MATGCRLSSPTVAPPAPGPYKFMGFGAMDVTKPYNFTGFGAMDVTKPYEFIRFGAMDVTKAFRFMGFVAMDVTKAFRFMGFWAIDVAKPDEFSLVKMGVVTMLCYAIVLPGRKSAFRAGFWPDCSRESTEIGPPAGRRPAGGPISVLSW